MSAPLRASRKHLELRPTLRLYVFVAISIALSLATVAQR